MSQLRQAFSKGFSSSSRDLDIEYAALIAFRESLKSPEAVNQVIKSTNNLKVDGNPAELRQAIGAFDSNGNLNSQSAMYSRVEERLIIKRARNQLGLIGISDSSKADSKAASSRISDIDALAIDAVCSESNKKLEELFMPEFMQLQQKMMEEMESRQDSPAPFGKQKLTGAMKESADLRQKNQEKSNAAIGKIVREARKSGPLLDSSKGYAASTALTTALDKRIAEILKKKPSLAPAATASSTPPSSEPRSDMKQAASTQPTTGTSSPEPLSTPSELQRAEYIALRAFRAAIATPDAMNQAVKSHEALRKVSGGALSLSEAMEEGVFDSNGSVAVGSGANEELRKRARGILGDISNNAPADAKMQLHEASDIDAYVLDAAAAESRHVLTEMYRPLADELLDRGEDEDIDNHGRLGKNIAKTTNQAIAKVIVEAQKSGEPFLDPAKGYAASAPLLAAIDARMEQLAAADLSLRTEAAPAISASSSSSSASSAPAAAPTASVAEVASASSVQPTPMPKKESAPMSAQKDKPVSDVKSSLSAKESDGLAEYIALRALRKSLSSPDKIDAEVFEAGQVKSDTTFADGRTGKTKVGLKKAISEGVFNKDGMISPTFSKDYVRVDRGVQKLRDLGIEDDSQKGIAGAEPKNISTVATMVLDAVAMTATVEVRNLFQPEADKAAAERSRRERQIEKEIEARGESFQHDESIEERAQADKAERKTDIQGKLLDESTEKADKALAKVIKEVRDSGQPLFDGGPAGYSPSPAFLAAIDQRIQDIGETPLLEEMEKVQVRIGALNNEISVYRKRMESGDRTAEAEELEIMEEELRNLQKHQKFLQQQSSHPINNASPWQERVAKHKWQVGGGALVAGGVGAALIADAAAGQSAGHHLKEAYDYLQNAQLPDVGGPSALDIFLIMGAGYLLYKLTDLIVDKISPNSAGENAENSAPSIRPKPQIGKKLLGLGVGVGVGAGLAAGASALFTNDNDPAAFFKTQMVDSDLEAWMLYAGVALVAALIVIVAPKIVAAAERTNEKALGKVVEDNKSAVVSVGSRVEQADEQLEKERVAVAEPTDVGPTATHSNATQEPEDERTGPQVK